MKITIEKRINKDGDKQNIRLVYWYGSRRNEEGKLVHIRKREILDLYLYADPKTKPEKQHNKETLQTVEQIKSKRIAEAASGQHGFTDSAKVSANFYSFFKQIMETKKTNESSTNYSDVRRPRRDDQRGLLAGRGIRRRRQTQARVSRLIPLVLARG